MAMTREDPTPRVGQLLSAARARHGRSEQDVAIAVGIPLRLVRHWEQGTEIPTDVQIARLAALYGEPVEQLLPARDVASLDPVAGTLTVGTETVDVDLDGAANEALLERYVSLVRSQRGLGDTTVIDLRDEDIGALASVLDLTDSILHQRLERIIGLTAAEAAEVAHKMRRWRLLAPLAGLAVGALGLFGVTQAFGGGDSGHGSPSASTVAVVAPSGVPSAALISAPGASTVTVPAATSLAPVTSSAPATAGPTAGVAAPPPPATAAPRSGGSPSPVRPIVPNIGAPLQVTPSPTVPPSTAAPTTAPPATVPGAVAVPGDNNEPSVTAPPTTAPTTPPTSATTIPVDIGGGGTQVVAP
ncbi:MAG: hypothetical protein JWL70_2075 [Acidimicrobiia bacterium]|nr:hypothetical protein [Acidimicrobiia bacterium]